MPDQHVGPLQFHRIAAVQHGDDSTIAPLARGLEPRRVWGRLKDQSYNQQANGYWGEG
jgi:hypothetical protein